MAFNEELNARIKKIVSHWENVEEKRMFGGTCHLINGNMVSGVYKDFLILRLGIDQAKNLLIQDKARPFDITGRPMKGWVMIAKEFISDDNELENYLNLAKKFVESLPSK